MTDDIGATFYADNAKAVAEPTPSVFGVAFSEAGPVRIPFVKRIRKEPPIEVVVEPAVEPVVEQVIEPVVEPVVEVIP